MTVQIIYTDHALYIFETVSYGLTVVLLSAVSPEIP